MKNYLVAYNVGVVKTTQIQVSDEYIPSSDNMKTIKREVIKNEHPCYVKLSAAPSNCGGYINMVEQDKVTEEKLQIIAISNLDV